MIPGSLLTNQYNSHFEPFQHEVDGWMFGIFLPAVLDVTVLGLHADASLKKDANLRKDLDGRNYNLGCGANHPDRRPEGCGPIFGVCWAGFFGEIVG